MFAVGVATLKFAVGSCLSAVLRKSYAEMPKSHSTGDNILLCLFMLRYINTNRGINIVFENDDKLISLTPHPQYLLP
jgi:hypothetical protein